MIPIPPVKRKHCDVHTKTLFLKGTGEVLEFDVISSFSEEIERQLLWESHTVTSNP